jgi:hypothetical protein
MLTNYPKHAYAPAILITAGNDLVVTRSVKFWNVAIMQTTTIAFGDVHRR